MADGLSTLMRAQCAAEFELAHRWPPFITDRDPPAMGTYLTTCINGDGAKYVATHYWNNHWHTGPFVKVNGWLACPPP